MINEIKAKLYCKEDISKIENYAEALADTSRTWDLHHRTEIWWNCSRKDLIDNECYFNRKACELIFLTRSEHIRLHKKNKVLTEEHRKKISASLKGHQRSKESIKKSSAALKGKTWKLINGKRVWLSKEGK